MPIGPSDVADFEIKQDAFEVSRIGRWTLGSISRVRETDLTSVLLADDRLLRDVGRLNNWAARFPTDIARSPDFEFIDFGPMSDLEAGRAMLETLSVISTLTHAKFLQDPSAAGLDADDIIRLAGGIDPAARRLRGPLIPPIDDDVAAFLKGFPRPKAFRPDRRSSLQALQRVRTRGGLGGEPARGGAPAWQDRQHLTRRHITRLPDRNRAH